MILRLGVHLASKSCALKSFVFSGGCLYLLGCKRSGFKSPIAAARATPPKAAFDDSCLTPEFVKDLAHLSVNPRRPKLAVEYLAKAGIQVICLPHLPRTYLDGAALRLPDGQPVIGLKLRHDRVDNF